MSVEPPPPTYENIIKNFSTTCEKLKEIAPKTQDIDKALDNLLVYYCVFNAFYIVSINDIDASVQQALSQQLIQAEQFILKIKLQFPTIFTQVEQSRKWDVIQKTLPSNVDREQDIAIFVKDVGSTKLPINQSKDILQSSYLYTAVKKKLRELVHPSLQRLLAAAFVQNVFTNDDETQVGLSSCIIDYNNFGFKELGKDYKPHQSSTAVSQPQPQRPNFPDYQRLLNYLYISASTPQPSSSSSASTTPQLPQPHMNLIPALLGGASVLLAVVSTVFAN